ncbi:retrovirus-related pol polyprotein from transposon TNT 1-94, partial [Tanacetum coccineum]
GIANMANAPCDVVGLRERDGLYGVAGIEVKIDRDDKQCNWQEKLVLYVLGITRYKKTPYELIKGRKPNVQYFHVFGSLCYPTNDHEDLGKMKPKADIGIFIGYSKSSGGFRIDNRRTRRIMETIHFQDSSEDSNDIQSKEDLDNLFGPLYEEYYETRSAEVSDNSVANTLDNEDTTSSSSIIIEENEAPQIVSSSEEPIVHEPTTSVSNNHSDEQVQEDVEELDENIFIIVVKIKFNNFMINGAGFNNDKDDYSDSFI